MSMKTNSLFVLLFYFLCSSAFGAVKDAPVLANAGMLAAFDSTKIEASELLDGSTFSFMSIETAKNFGITKIEMDSYNRELDQLNEMMTEVSHELEVMKGATLEDAVSLWLGLKGAVSAATLKALHKITKRKK